MFTRLLPMSKVASIRFLDSIHIFKIPNLAGDCSMSIWALVEEIRVSVVSEPEKKALPARQAIIPIISDKGRFDCMVIIGS